MKRVITAAKYGKPMSEYSNNIVREAFRANMGLDEDDTSEDGEIEDYSPDEIFDMVCDYEGLIGYGESIRDWVLDIYDVYLE